jgi:hypothetical protein
MKSEIERAKPGICERMLQPANAFNRGSWQGLVSVLRFGVAGLWVGCALLCSHTVCAQFGPPGAIQARSHSGQFVIQALPDPGTPQELVELESNPNFIQLDPKLLPISCERIKQVVWRELGATAPWSGKIFFGLYPAKTADDPISFAADQFRDGWEYRLMIPNLLERSRYVRVLVQALLLEMANRNAKAHSAEIPTWLTEGFTRQVLASNEIEIILPRQPGTKINGMWLSMTSTNAQRRDPLEQAHTELCAGTPLTFQQLSWPQTEFTIEGQALFRSSAQLFVARLLQLRDGPACMRAMLAELPEHYNWQFAFLHAFQEHFSRPLEIEKWWALQAAHFTGRELTQAWGTAESWQKLDECVHSYVQVRLDTNDLPLRAEISLQTVIREWDKSRQTQALQIKLREMEQVRLRLAKDHIVLLDEYRQTLASYLQNRDHVGLVLPFRKHAVQQRTVEATLRELDVLDGRLKALRPPEEALMAAGKQ